jgi:acetyl-CoA carboxylase biotin carboxyl carrier protein
MKIDKKLIKELTGYLNEFELTELEYGNNDLKIKVSKFTSGSNISAPIGANIVSSPKPNQSKSISGTKVTSPIIGTAYLSSEPGGKKFSEVGKKIKKGDTIMIVEAMKTMNHIPSPSEGVIKEICVEDGQPVEFGQTIIILE